MFLFCSGALYGAIYMDNKTWEYRLEMTYTALVSMAEIGKFMIQSRLGLLNSSKPSRRTTMKKPSSDMKQNISVNQKSHDPKEDYEELQ